MTIKLFHKPEYTGKDKATNRFTLTIKEYSVEETEEEVKVHFSITWRGKEEYEDTFIIEKMEEGSVYELWYNTNRRETILRNYFIVNPYSATFGFQQDNALIYFGRIHFCSNVILLYLAGRFADVENVKNVEMSEANESSVSAMSKISDEAKQAFRYTEIKRDFLNKIDTLDSVSYLEAQVDTLTKLVIYLAKLNGIENDELLNLLEYADQYSVFEVKDGEAIKKELDNKKRVRELQQSYYIEKASLDL